MSTISVIMAFAFVLGLVVVIAYALFEISPFAHHTDVYHAPGERQQSPRLD